MDILLKLRIKQNIKLKKIVVMELVLGALLLLFAMGFQNYQEDYKNTQRIIVGLDNQDQSIPANMLVNNFKKTEHFAGLFEIKNVKEADFQRALQNEEIDAAVTMPEGFAEALYHFENKPITLVTKTSTPIKNAILEETLSGYSRYVKAVDMACYAFNTVVEDKETDSTVIDAYEKGVTVDLLYATLNRGEYFTQCPIADLKALNSTEYYAIVLPFSLLAFLSLIGAFKQIRERNLSIQKRIRVSGVSTLKQQLANYISELLFLLLLFSPLIVWQIVVSGAGAGLRFLVSILISGLFFSALWKALSHALRVKENLLVLGISISFLNALISGAIVPYILLNRSIKSLSAYSINFNLTKFTMGLSGFSALLPFLLLFVLLFVIDLRQEARAS